MRQTAVWVRPRVNNGFHEDQWLTWKFRGVHDPRRLRDWASQDGVNASVATSITTPVIFHRYHASIIFQKLDQDNDLFQEIHIEHYIIKS